MTALSDDRSLDQVNFGALSMLQLGIKAAETLYMGSSAAAGLAVPGYLVAAGSEASGPVLGVASHRADNSAGASGAASCNLAQGMFRRVNSSTSALAQTDAPCVCYAEDDQVARKNPTATAPILGIFMGFEADGVTPLVFISAANNIALASGGGAVAPNVGTVQSARYVMTTNVADLAVFTVAQDGVTGVAGNVVLLANQTTPSQNGLYVIGTVGGGTAPLTRLPAMPAGAILPPGTEVHVDAGTLFADTVWFVPTAATVTVGTTSHTWYPRSVTQTVAFPINTGTITITNVPILSASKTFINVMNAIEVTADLTVRYGLNGVATAGTVGTASAVIIAEIAAGTVNVDDDSTLLICVIN